MQNKITKHILTLFFIFNIYIGNAQDSTAVDYLRSIGKLYSVIAVIAVIFVLLAVFLFRIDRKLTKLENQVNNDNIES